MLNPKNQWPPEQQNKNRGESKDQCFTPYSKQDSLDILFFQIPGVLKYYFPLKELFLNVRENFKFLNGKSNIM